ncbi:MAG: hypothetical protein E4H01_01470 [Lysobacterales bacterium]|nr:MAG: hypothetical protein E4H01_01470 [Xanthomonadales bacterium]
MSFEALQRLAPTLMEVGTAQSIDDITPDIGVAVSSLVEGVRNFNLSKESVQRQEDIGEQEARLRAIQARRLLGQVRPTTAGRGFVVGDQASSSTLNAHEIRYLESLDVARARFRFQSLADQVRRQGQADLVAAGVAVGGAARDAFRTFDDRKREQALRNAKTLLPGNTILQNRPFLA